MESPRQTVGIQQHCVWGHSAWIFKEKEKEKEGREGGSKQGRKCFLAHLLLLIPEPGAKPRPCFALR
jgi:hypothetical protein